VSAYNKLSGDTDSPLISRSQTLAGWVWLRETLATRDYPCEARKLCNYETIAVQVHCWVDTM